MGCRTLVIAHGKSELIMVKDIASRMRMDIETFSWDGGQRSIKLEHISDVLRTPPFESEMSLKRFFPRLEYRSGKGVRMPNLKIFPIMDRDGDDIRDGAYISGDMFRDSPFFGRIIPIFNIGNLDIVLEGCGYGKVEDKMRFYRKTFSTIDVTDLYNRLRESYSTNLDVFLYHCMQHCPPFQGRISSG